MQKGIWMSLAASALLAGCSSLGGGSGGVACPQGVEPAEGYVGSAGNSIIVGGGGDFVHSKSWSSDAAFHECEGVAAAAPEPAPEPEPEPEPDPTPVTVNVPVKLDAQTLFATDSSELGDAGRAALDSLAAGIESLDKVRRVVVVGHTDSTGTDEYNQGLSERRAQSVADYLQSKLSNLDIAAVGRGETKPVASNDTALGRAKNRRVEVVVIGSKTETR